MPNDSFHLTQNEILPDTLDKIIHEWSTIIKNKPNDIYTTHKYILSGNSSFKRTIGKSNDSIVYESLYIK